MTFRRLCLSASEVVRSLVVGFYLLLFFSVIFGCLLFGISIVRAHTSQAFDPSIKNWVEGLKDSSGAGCCATADGIPLEEPDWEMNANGYRVKIKGRWYEVPERAVITQPNKLNHAVVWFYWQHDGTVSQPYIRCFLPGAIG